MPRRPSTTTIVIAGTAALGILSAFLIYTFRWNSPPIRSDGVGHYLYLPAALIDHDLTLEKTVQRDFGGQRPEAAGVNRAETGRMLIKYPVGEAILLLPFFAVAHLVTRGVGLEPNGFSTVYQYATVAAGLTYMTVGLLALAALLRRTFSPGVTTATLVVVTFGTNLFHYGTYDTTFSHIYSFCMVVLFLRSVERWYVVPGVATTVGLAVFAGLITLLRPTNSVVFLWAALYGIRDRGSAAGRLTWWRQHAMLMAIGALAYGAVLLPQLLYWKFITGHWIIFSYEGEGFGFTNPQLLPVLFSVRKGLFFWSPILVLAVAGFWALRRYRPEYILPSVTYLVVHLYVVSSWHDWAYAGSFGHRAFVESLPVFALGYAALCQTAVERGRMRLLAIVSTALVLLCAQLTVKYWWGIVPYDRTTWDQFVAALARW